MDGGGEEPRTRTSSTSPPSGSPSPAAAIFIAEADIHGLGLAYSTDRGRRFRPSVYDPALFGDESIRVWVVAALTRGPHAGRVLQGGINGLAYSDDGGESFRPSALWARARYGCGEIVEGEGPEGQPRLFAVVTDTTLPYENVTHSDDGGAT